MRQLPSICGRYAAWRDGKCRRVFLSAVAVIIMMTLTACGGGGSSDPQQSAVLSGNWQFTIAPLSDGNQSDPTFGPGLLGGFLLQNEDGSYTGQAVYSLTSSSSNSAVCNAGTAALTNATISGTTVTLTYVAGTPSNNITFTLNGTLSTTSNGPATIQGNASSSSTTVVTPSGGTACGYTETSGLQWSAVFVPPLTGTLQGFFHSTSGNSFPQNEDFPVSGSLTQGANIGASNATVTGTLSFYDAETNLSDYPCFATASVNGQISGSSVILQIVGTNGSIIGQIGEPAGSTTGVNPVVFESTPGGYILGGVGPSYLVQTSACKGGGSIADTTVAGDSGNICLGLNSTNACQQPITLSPAAVIFPPQLLDVAATTQTITLTNDSGQELDNLSLSQYQDTTQFAGESDFNGQPNFTFADNCGAGNAIQTQQPFSLGGSYPTSCVITVVFAPQEGCAWLPSAVAPAQCPSSLTASVTVNSPLSADNDTMFSVPVTGIGLSALQPSVQELDFGAENAVNPQESSLPQILTFTNYGANPVQILSSAPCLNATNGVKIGVNALPRPLNLGSAVAGLQTVANYSPFPGVVPDNTTIQYDCDSDPVSKLPNFVISLDTCTGSNLAPQQSCSLQVSYTPQAATYTADGDGLDAYLELNTVQCSSVLFPTGASSDCEIDSGRFPVELKANAPSPLRMSPSAGLDFGDQKHGTSSTPMAITLFNDPNLPNAQPVTFVGRISVQGSSFSELDDCPATLAPGSSCTLSVTFSPSGTGFSSGTLTINYSPEPTSEPQVVYLRGMGQ
jgi:hypothetical protein